uniref:Uncharacterized protein n=1 Tax=Myripristis murdjan TaxID=586833 RepID=A0A667ZAN3_9TELE
MLAPVAQFVYADYNFSNTGSVGRYDRDLFRLPVLTVLFYLARFSGGPGHTARGVPCPRPPSQEEDEDDDEFEEVDFEDLDDTRSIASDDSFYPPDDVFADSERSLSPDSPEPLSFFQACCTNNATIVRIMIRQGVRAEDVEEADRNNRTGLLVACYQGFVDVVIALSQCPYLDVNWQDSEGNTALITAAQAGVLTLMNHSCISSITYLSVKQCRLIGWHTIRMNSYSYSRYEEQTQTLLSTFFIYKIQKQLRVE